MRLLIDEEEVDVDGEKLGNHRPFIYASWGADEVKISGTFLESLKSQSG